MAFSKIQIFIKKSFPINAHIYKIQKTMVDI